MISNNLQNTVIQQKDHQLGLFFVNLLQACGQIILFYYFFINYLMEKIIRNIIVTGSNKGIGYGIVENLAQKEGWNIIMACRNYELANKSRLQLLGRFPKATIQVEVLDVSNKQSVSNFIQIVKNKYKHIDVLVNNAGIYVKGDINPETLNKTLATNFYGTINFTEQILPYISAHGKIITVGSSLGTFKSLKIKYQYQKFQNPNFTQEQLFEYIRQYQKAVAEGNQLEKGFPINFYSSYGISKMGINYYTRILSKRKSILDRSIQVYILCPGYVSTDLNDHKGFLSIQEGVITPVYLIQLPFEFNPNLQGQFFQKCAISSL